MFVVLLHGALAQSSASPTTDSERTSYVMESSVSIAVRHATHIVAWFHGERVSAEAHRFDGDGTQRVTWTLGDTPRASMQSFLDAFHLAQDRQRYAIREGPGGELGFVILQRREGDTWVDVGPSVLDHPLPLEALTSGSSACEYLFRAVGTRCGAPSDRTWGQPLDPPRTPTFRGLLDWNRFHTSGWYVVHEPAPVYPPTPPFFRVDLGADEREILDLTIRRASVGPLPPRTRR